jgi:hypothetical protein
MRITFDGSGSELKLARSRTALAFQPSMKSFPKPYCLEAALVPRARTSPRFER